MQEEIVDPIGDIVAIRQIVEDIRKSRLARVDEASEGFGETLDQSVDEMKEEQGIQALDHLTKQFSSSSRLESEMKGTLVDLLTKHIEREDNNLCLWTNQCETISKAFDSYEQLMDNNQLHVPGSPRLLKSGSTSNLSPRVSSMVRQSPSSEGPRASQLNFKAIRSKRQKAREQTDELLDNSELLDQGFSRLQQNAAHESSQKGLLTIAIEHLTLPYFYELAAYGEWHAEHVKAKQGEITTMLAVLLTDAAGPMALNCIGRQPRKNPPLKEPREC